MCLTRLLSALVGDADIEALLGDGAQIEAMLAVEAALARASADTGWVSVQSADAVCNAIDAFQPEWEGLRAGMVQDGVVVPALVRQLREAVAVDGKTALHRGATSQDITDTALMIQVGRVFDAYYSRIRALVEQVDALLVDNAGLPLMAHTRMQAALATTWGAKLLAWRNAIVQLGDALSAQRETALAVQLGGPVGDRRSFDGLGDAIAARLAERLGLQNSACWHGDRNRIFAVGTLAARISGTLGKIGADIGLLAQSEIAAIKVTGGGGSSAMAHKSNPVNAEILVALARDNATSSAGLGQALVHEYERSGAAWTLEWIILPRMLITAGASLRIASKLFDQVQLLAAELPSKS